MAPLYRNIAAQLLSEFSSGNRATDVALPSETSLQRMFGASRTTVRRALAELQSAGMVMTRRGVGSTFVADKINQPIASRVRFRGETGPPNTRPRARILSYSARKASTAEIARFGNSPEQMVGELCRLLLINGQPVIHQRTVLRLPDPESLTAGLFENASLYGVLRRQLGLSISAISKTLEAVETPADVARLLLVQEGAAAFRIQRIGSAPNGSVIELSTNIVRGDRYYFSYSGANDAFER